MKIGIAQINTTVGDLAGNAALIFAAYQELVAQGAELVITPELALTGYPPQDLLFAGDFVADNLEMLAELEKKIGMEPLVIGFVDPNLTAYGKPFYNAAAVLKKDTLRIIAHKRLLPTYDVFDEARYFEPGKKSSLFNFNGKKIGITICEDLWTPDYLPRALYHVDPPKELVNEGAEILLNLSASPFQLGKPARRLAMIQAQAKRLQIPIVYCNAIGGNDQLVFDGHSLVVAAGGKSSVVFQGCREEKKVVDLSLLGETSTSPCDELHELYDALVLGLRDYLLKCGFKHVLLGLSGGIDSALVSSLAVAALGPDAVTGVLMPGPFSSQGSIDDALALAQNLGMKQMQLPITPLYEKILRTLQVPFSGFEENATEENLQARLRGIMLMALSNKLGSLLLTTGNKSELAVGYCTLYGDMCGGFALISDLPKTLVYRLATWINREQEIIPWNTIRKAPSAELRLDQTDQDSLPPYEILDAILQLLIEENQSIARIVSQGFDEATVRWIVKQVHRNEHKRQQAAPGLKVTGRAFGMGRRFPIAQKYL